jgi:hypothetical protein
MFMSLRGESEYSNRSVSETRNAERQRDHGLSCLLWRDNDSNVFISHCLNFDLMDTGRTQNEALSNLKIVIKRHIEYCIARYPQGLKRSVSKKRWQKFYAERQKQLQENPAGVVVEKLQMKSFPPLPKYEISIWIQGVSTGSPIV